jgi:hypothetical protein
MSKTVSIDSASAAELETPHSLDEAMETGFLPDDPHYRLTGEFKSEKKDASAAATQDKEKTPGKEGASATPDDKDEREQEDPSENPDASAASSSKAAPSESAQSQTGRESRWQKRENELKKLREENARLKSQSSQPQPRSEAAQVSQPATETAKAAPKPKIDDVDAKTGKPKYKNFSEYEDAKDAWLRQETIREFQETTAKTQRETAQQQAEREIGKTLAKKFEGPRAKYADFDKVALGEHLVIPKGSVTELFMLDSDHAGEVLYHLGQHPEILQGFYANYDPKTGKFQSLITPQRQFRKLMEIEATLSGSGSSGSGAGAAAAAAAAGDNSSSSSAKPVTQASRPPHQVSGKGTVAKDAVEQALDDGDFETYQRAQNAKELARLKRK